MGWGCGCKVGGAFLLTLARQRPPAIHFEMPLLTELAETVVGCGSYKHAAPTELVVSWRFRCYKLFVISVIFCSNPSQQFRTESETPWTGRSETCPTPGQELLAGQFTYHKPLLRSR